MTNAQRLFEDTGLAQGVTAEELDWTWADAGPPPGEADPTLFAAGLVLDEWQKGTLRSWKSERKIDLDDLCCRMIEGEDGPTAALLRLWALWQSDPTTSDPRDVIVRTVRNIGDDTWRLEVRTDRALGRAKLTIRRNRLGEPYPELVTPRDGRSEHLVSLWELAVARVRLALRQRPAGTEIEACPAESTGSERLDARISDYCLAEIDEEDLFSGYGAHSIPKRAVDRYLAVTARMLGCHELHTLHRLVLNGWDFFDVVAQEGAGRTTVFEIPMVALGMRGHADAPFSILGALLRRTGTPCDLFDGRIGPFDFLKFLRGSLWHTMAVVSLTSWLREHGDATRVERFTERADAASIGLGLLDVDEFDPDLAVTMAKQVLDAARRRGDDAARTVAGILLGREQNPRIRAQYGCHPLRAHRYARVDQMLLWERALGPDAVKWIERSKPPAAGAGG